MSQLINNKNTNANKRSSGRHVRKKLNMRMACHVRAIADMKVKSKKSLGDDPQRQSDIVEPIKVVRLSEILINDKLPVGNFGEAYEVFLKKGKGRFMLKKMAKEVESDPILFADSCADMMNEGQILSTLNHPNILSLHAWSSSDMINAYINGTAPSFLVLEQVQETLAERIFGWQTQKPKAWNVAFRQKQQKLLAEKCNVILDLAKALEYLAEKRIIHRALCTKSIGFDTTGKLKVFDFNGSREVPLGFPNTLFKFTKKIGVPRYMAPEVGRGDKYNIKVRAVAVVGLALS